MLFFLVLLPKTFCPFSVWPLKNQVSAESSHSHLTLSHFSPPSPVLITFEWQFCDRARQVGRMVRILGGWVVGWLGGGWKGVRTGKLCRPTLLLADPFPVHF